MNDETLMSPKWLTRLSDQQLVTPDSTVLDALKLLESSGLRVLFMVDSQGCLVRTVTDGDLRRLLLSTLSFETRLKVLSAQKPLMAELDEDVATLVERMAAKGIEHLVVVDATNKPIGMVYRRHIDDSILLSTPHLSKQEKQYVDAAFRTNWVAPVGPNIDAFESELAETVGAGYAAALSSGTAALHLALRVLGVSPGDVVFCSNLTFVASANPILYQGATPVFIDAEPDSWNMSSIALERALKAAKSEGKVPKAVVVVNLYGQSADYDPILKLCDAYGVPVVEDAAESLGATYQDKASGTLGCIGVFSFNGNKIITTSGGGMLVSDNEEYIQKARFLATQAKEPAPYYQHKEVGYNYRMSNVLAGIGRGQLKVLEDRVNARRAVFEYYRDNLSGYEQLQWMPEASFGRSTRWLSAASFICDNPIEVRDSVIAALAEQHIEARHVWKPMQRQPVFKGMKFYSHDGGTTEDCVSDELFAGGICLPSGSNLTEAQLSRVVEVVQQTLDEH